MKTMTRCVCRHRDMRNPENTDLVQCLNRVPAGRRKCDDCRVSR
jgi:hypothetical protein